KSVADTFEVRTPEIIVSVKGTRFLVAAEPGPDFTSVFRGAVGLEGDGFEEVSVRAGFTGAGGEVLVSSFEDPWSGWAAGASARQPSLELLRDGEVKGAIQSAREDLSEVPAKADPTRDDSSGKGEGEGKGKQDGGDGLVLGQVDPVADVARGEAKHG